MAREVKDERGEKRPTTRERVLLERQRSVRGVARKRRKGKEVEK